MKRMTTSKRRSRGGKPMVSHRRKGYQPHSCSAFLMQVAMPSGKSPLRYQSQFYTRLIQGLLFLYNFFPKIWVFLFQADQKLISPDDSHILLLIASPLFDGSCPNRARPSAVNRPPSSSKTPATHLAAAKIAYVG